MQYRPEYYERLQAVHDTGDWEGWLAFFLRGVAEVSAEATETVDAFSRCERSIDVESRSILVAPPPTATEFLSSSIDGLLCP